MLVNQWALARPLCSNLDCVGIVVERIISEALRCLRILVA
tara:strand:+ start:616 stop:735 length:120 start_codon:yes stop_codon:yes gene_type:complete